MEERKYNKRTAIESNPGSVCFLVKFSSSNVFMP